MDLMDLMGFDGFVTTPLRRYQATDKILVKVPRLPDRVFSFRKPATIMR